MRRGEVWWAELLGDAGFRPVVVVSRSEGIEARTNVTVAEITSVLRWIPTEVRLDVADGMPKACAANMDNLQTVPQSHLRERICLLTTARIAEMDVALRYALGLEW